MQHEKVNEVYNIYSNCMASCNNYHIINILHSEKFTNVNLTHSKLAKHLHLKIGAKIIKKLNTNKFNYKIMPTKRTLLLNETNECGLTRKCITEVDTELGYLHVLEYVLQDYSYVHIVQYHFNKDVEENNLLPKQYCVSFYKEKDNALKFAHEIAEKLLLQY